MNHRPSPSHHHSWYKPFPNGWFMPCFYPDEETKPSSSGYYYPCWVILLPADWLLLGHMASYGHEEDVFYWMGSSIEMFNLFNYCIYIYSYRYIYIYR